MQSVEAQSESVTSVGIVGGGISGLAAAWHLISRRPELDITVYEASDRVGGKLRQEDVGGHRIDVGAESALWRRPEVVELLEELNVEAVHPMRYPALLWSRGRLENLPAGTLMGIPSDPQSAAGLLDEAEVDRALDERPISRLDGDDISVGDAVEMALGSAVVDRMVEPLLGGVYAGHARELSAKTTVPSLYRALVSGASLTEAARVSASAVSSDDPRQVFGAPAGGMGGLPELLRTRLAEAGVKVVTGARVDSIRRSPAFKGTWHVEVDRDGLPEPVEVDGVVLAVPAPIAAQLLPDLLGAPVAKEALSGIEYASMAIVSYAFPAEVAEKLPSGTGFLVPAIDGHAIKASTFSSVKWPWLGELAPEMTYVRVSLGRHRETEILTRSDEDLINIGLDDLEKAVGFELPEPVDAHVQRWQDGLPQYAVGHAELMSKASSSLEALPAFELAGAYCDGVGIPACVATARRAADSILEDFDRPLGDVAAASATSPVPTNEGAAQ